MAPSVLVLCHANVCRSPVAEALMCTVLPSHQVASAGIQAIDGAGADPEMIKLSDRRGLDLTGHRARRLTLDMAARHDLILVMERSQRQYLHSWSPQLTGRVMLLGHWLSASPDIADPYKKTSGDYERALTLIEQSTRTWADRLAIKTKDHVAKT